MSIEVDIEVDAKGLRCPEPLMVVRNRMMDMTAGQVLLVVATDQESDEDEYRYWIKKG